MDLMPASEVDVSAHDGRYSSSSMRRPLIVTPPVLNVLPSVSGEKL